MRNTDQYINADGVYITCQIACM